MFRVWLVILVVLWTPAPTFAAVEDESPDPLVGLEYRSIGPAAGGRISRVAGVSYVVP
jgi:hypothetical protein